MGSRQSMTDKQIAAKVKAAYENSVQHETRMAYKQINFKLSDDMWLAAKVKAAQNRMGLSEAIRGLLKKWIEEPVKPFVDDSLRFDLPPKTGK